MQERMDAMQVRDIMAGKYVPKQPAKRAPGRGVRPDNNTMNGTEKRYAAELDRMKAAGEIADWKFHAMTLTIADPPNAKCARWTPDFCVWTNDMVLQFHEVKGHMMDHALVRIKVAAAQFPHPVIVVKRVKGEWKREEM